MAQFTTPLAPATSTPSTSGGSSATSSGGAPFSAFLAGLVLVSIPVWIMDNNGNNKGSWSYVTLILFILVLAYSKSLIQFASSLQTLARGG